MKKKSIIAILLFFAISFNSLLYADGVDMRLYLQRDTTKEDEQMYHGVKYEPKVGAYLAMFAEGDKVVHDPWTGNPFYFDAVPKLTGKKHAMYMIYIHYDKMEFNHYLSHYKKAKETGCAMQVCLEPNTGLDKVVDGEYLHKFAKQAKESGIPIFLRFANEMNDPGSTWGGDTALYIEKFRLVADIMHKEAPNVVMCWCPNDWGHHGFGDAHEWYPGDDYVDWVGVSSYPPYTKDGESKHRTKYTDRFTPIYNTYAERKPIFLSEGAPIQNVEFTDIDVSKYAAKELKEFYDEIARRFPGIKAVFYWDNEETWGAKRKCLLSNNKLVLDAYKKAIKDSFFLSNIGDNSKVIYEDFSAFKNKSVENKLYKMSAYVGNRSLKTDKVAYYVNDVYIGETKGSPYTINLDLRKYAGQKVRVKAEAYDTSNVYISTVEYELNVVKADNKKEEIKEEETPLAQDKIDKKYSIVEAFEYNPFQFVVNDSFILFLLMMAK